MRAYVGFRPATPDRLPIIGADPKVGRLLHATGHEGAGVGLAQVTAELVQNIVLGETPALDITAFAPGRFQREATTGRRPGHATAQVGGQTVARGEERSRDDAVARAKEQGGLVQHFCRPTGETATTAF